MKNKTGSFGMFGNLDAGKENLQIPSGEYLLDRLSSGYYTSNRFDNLRQTNKFIHRRMIYNPHIWWASDELAEGREENLRAIHHLSVQERERKFADENSVDIIDVPEATQQRILNQMKEHQDTLVSLLTDKVATISLAVSPAIDQTVQILKHITDDNDIDSHTKELWKILNKVSNLKVLQELLDMFELNKAISKKVLQEYISKMFSSGETHKEDIITRLMKTAYAQKKQPRHTKKVEDTDE